MEKKIYIITGEVQSGKTRWLTACANFLIERNKTLAGVICPAIFQDNQKIRIDALLLPSMEKFNLAMRKKENSEGFSKKWNFNDEAMNKINNHFLEISSYDYLIVDELGPLELERGEGLTNAVKLLKSGKFETALVVVRPHLVEVAKKVFLGTCNIEVIYDIDSSNYNFLI